MAGRCLTHDRVRWVTGIVRKVNDESYAIDLACGRCGEKQHRRYCCFDKARDLGLECFAKLHFLCAEKIEKETVL
jgi:hypothetical protein